MDLRYLCAVGVRLFAGGSHTRVNTAVAQTAIFLNQCGKVTNFLIKKINI